MSKIRVKLIDQLFSVDFNPSGISKYHIVLTYNTNDFLAAELTPGKIFKKLSNSQSKINRYTYRDWYKHNINGGTYNFNIGEDFCTINILLLPFIDLDLNDLQSRLTALYNPIKTEVLPVNNRSALLPFFYTPWTGVEVFGNWRPKPNKLF